MTSFRELKSASPRRAGPRPNRQDRLPRLIGAARDADQVLANLRVFVVGCGAVGRAVALHFARMQVGTIWLVDSKKYKPESLLTQPIGPSEVNGWKASLTARACKQISPASRVYYFNGPLQSLGLTTMADAGVVVLATDNLPTEVEAGQRCARLAIPLVQASVHGESLVAQVRFFSNHEPSAPCPACGFNQEEWEHADKQTVFACDAGSSGQPAFESQGPPTMSLSCLCSLAADLTLTQILRHQLGLGTDIRNTLLEYCAYNHRVTQCPLPQKPNCGCHHRPFQRLRPPLPLLDCSLSELLRQAGISPESDPPTFSFDELCWAERGVCLCGPSKPVDRFITPEQQKLVRCPACKSSTCRHHFYTHRPVPYRFLEPYLGVPLRQLGAASLNSVLIHNAETGVLFQNPTRSHEN